MMVSPFWEALDRSLPGQSKALRTLASITRHRTLAHALLFVGPAGAGKLRAAVALAVAENCEDHGCMTCALCKSVDGLARRQSVHPDITIVSPEGAEYPIAQVRELRRTLQERPVELATKFLIVLGADRMRPVSANALLKTLEEPPDATCIVLLAEEWDALLPTVRSRCQLVQFRPVAEAELARRLVEEAGADPVVALAATRACGGRMDMAARLISVPAFTQARLMVETIIEDLERRDAHELIDDADTLVGVIEDVGAGILKSAEEGEEGGGGGGSASDDGDIVLKDEDIEDFAFSKAHAGRLRSLVREQRRRADLRARMEGTSVVLGLLGYAFRDLLCAAAGANDVVMDAQAVERRLAVLRHASLGGVTRALEAVVKARARIRANVQPKHAIAAMLFEIAEAARWRRRSA